LSLEKMFLKSVKSKFFDTGSISNHATVESVSKRRNLRTRQRENPRGDS